MVGLKKEVLRQSIAILVSLISITSLIHVYHLPIFEQRKADIQTDYK